jgi:hypothetical protein
MGCDQSKFSERGNMPLLRWDAPPGANATTALTRGPESGAASTVHPPKLCPTIPIRWRSTSRPGPRWSPASI